MKFTLFLVIVFIVKNTVYSQDSLIIFSEKIGLGDHHERYQETLDAYQIGENWKIWSFPFEKCISQPNPEHAGYLGDENLSTAWSVNTDSLDSIKNSIQIEMIFHGDSFLGAAYEFFGEINIFNGLCTNIESWTKNSRIKTFEVFYNGQYLCNVELIDTWHFQTFDISEFLKNPQLGKNLKNGIEVRSGDIIEFKIIDFYYGFGTKKAYISEFLLEGAKN